MGRLTKRMDRGGVEFLYLEGRQAKYSTKERTNTPLNNAIARLAAYEDTGLSPKALKEFIEAVAIRFGDMVVHDGRLHIGTAGSSVLEIAFKILGWDDPHPYPEGECQTQGCHEYASCMVPTENGHMRICAKCYMIIEARKILAAEQEGGSDG